MASQRPLPRWSVCPAVHSQVNRLLYGVFWYTSDPAINRARVLILACSPDCAALIVTRLPPPTMIVLCMTAFLANAVAVAASTLQVQPSRVDLQNPEATQQMLVQREDATGRLVDITRDVQFRIDPPNIAVVNDRGLIGPRTNGVGTITIEFKDTRQSIPITVSRLDDPLPISFRNQVIPILTKAGCNSGGCHGKAEGQNGFKLSVFGFDPRADHEALSYRGAANWKSAVSKGVGTNTSRWRPKNRSGQLPWPSIVALDCRGSKV